MTAHLSQGQLFIEGRIPSGSSHFQIYERAGQIAHRDVWYTKTLYTIALKIQFPKYVQKSLDLREIVPAGALLIEETAGTLFYTESEDRFVVLFLGEGPYNPTVAKQLRARIEAAIELFKRPWREEYQIKKSEVSFTKVSKQTK